MKPLVPHPPQALDQSPPDKRPWAAKAAAHMLAQDDATRALEARAESAEARVKELLAFWGDTEARSSEAHDVYQREAHRRGDVRHPDAYADLSEPTKEWDRVLVRWVAESLRAALAVEGNSKLPTNSGRTLAVEELKHNAKGGLYGDGERKAEVLWLIDKADCLRARVAELEAVLEEYGAHLSSICEVTRGPSPWCECGLDAALAKKGGGT